MINYHLKKKELKKRLLSDFSKLHGKFISLRYRNNSFYVRGHHNTGVAETHPLLINEVQISQEKWSLYQEACDLLGEYEALKNMMVLTFPKVKKEIVNLFVFYQEWKRMIGKDTLIMQTETGENTEKYKTTKDLYRDIILHVKDDI
ncbi:hypothetical protein IC221_12855 [Flammeovirga sp. EKP202]|nr:hypothetical protein [Flammeovirga sp. EKP202]